jgi:hypothetical protein
MFCRILSVAVVYAFFSSLLLCQRVSTGDLDRSGVSASTADSNPTPVESKRLLGLIPNYRTSPDLQNYKPLSAGEKLTVASQDAFDRGTVGLAALFAGESQLTNSNRTFGQGAAGFGRYLGAAYGDFAIGDYMTEAVFPILLHQDPRYFRRGTGTGRSRLGYAIGQIFRTHGDSGGMQFNYSEIFGNAAAVAISNAYYVDNRTAWEATSKLGLQIGVDTASNILKEFWPDLERKFRRKQPAGLPTQPN